MFALSFALALSATDLARPDARVVPGATQLSADPAIWFSPALLSQEQLARIRAKVPADEAAYAPCIGQVDEFDSKKCTFVPVEGDVLLETAVASLGRAWGVDVSRLVSGGLPVIRYLPGAPAVGKHGDEDRRGAVPNATLVVYLTDPSGAGTGGKTVFPEAGVTVSPQAGAVLSFENTVGPSGIPHPKAKHLVSAVPADAASDRLVVQIPLAHPAGAVPYAYPEHVSGAKKPGEHESLHGTDAQKGAYKSALAAGLSIAVAFMAAKAGKFDPADVPALEEQAKATGKFSAEDLTPPPAK